MSNKIYDNIGLMIPDVLLPKTGTDMSKWATVACDQFTSQPDYWEETKKCTCSCASTYNLMLPEIYLNCDDADDRIANINKTMTEYLNNGTLTKHESSMILLERTTPISPVRTGIVVALDLEKYDFRKGSDSLIRATEGTVIERIPPRMKIRKNADIEMPHIMILIDDPEKTVVEPIAEKAKSGAFECVYDFDMIQNGGHIKGYKISDEAICDNMADALSKLASKDVFSKKYNLTEDIAPLLFAVGDGNHSLASAKCHWEEVKAAGAGMDHPARFALCEIVNVHDSGILFEPIHRVLFGIDVENFTDGLTEYFGDKATCVYGGDGKFEEAYTGEEFGKFHVIPFCSPKGNGIIYIDSSVHTLAVGAIQMYIDDYLAKNPCVTVDYVHGDDVTRNLGSAENNMGILLPKMDKNDLFLTVIKNGSLPRKTFSMGEAFEKRYYIECREIR